MNLLKETLLDKLHAKYLHMPEYLEMGAWNKWHENTKKRIPKTYFILYTIPDEIDTVWTKLTSPITNAYYKLKHLILPNYWKRWIVKPKLRIGYNDCRELLLYSSMKLLSDFYEFQISDKGYVEWTTTEGSIHAINEMKAIYDWWQTYEKRHDEVWNLPKHIIEPEDIFAGDTAEEHPEYMTFIRKAGETEQALEDEADEMLSRLAKIRQALWD